MNKPIEKEEEEGLKEEVKKPSSSSTTTTTTTTTIETNGNATFGSSSFASFNDACKLGNSGFGSLVNSSTSSTNWLETKDSTSASSKTNFASLSTGDASWLDIKNSNVNDTIKSLAATSSWLNEGPSNSSSSFFSNLAPAFGASVKGNDKQKKNRIQEEGGESKKTKITPEELNETRINSDEEEDDQEEEEEDNEENNNEEDNEEEGEKKTNNGEDKNNKLLKHTSGFGNMSSAPHIKQLDVVPTGEESEVTLFQCKVVKAYRLLKEDKTWKEMEAGGSLKVNLARQGYGRVILRNQAKLRVLINGSILDTFKYDKIDDKKVRFTLKMDDSVETFLLRLGSAEELEDLTRAFYQCKLVAQMKEEEEKEQKE